jgi:hypothetical protein
MRAKDCLFPVNKVVLGGYVGYVTHGGKREGFMAFTEAAKDLQVNPIAGL